MPDNNKAHLGDGVYVIYNGDYSIPLALNHHNNIVIHLDIDILNKLNEFVKQQQIVNDNG